MLKFLTHKLRTHSLNEDNVSEKVEERDSGTESDDEADRAQPHDDLCGDVIMKWNDVTDIRCGSACAAPEPDLLYDHHSSEEELEVINGAPGGPVGAGSGAAARVVAPGGESRRRGASSPPPAAPEKRKWAPHAYADDLAARAPSSDDDDTKVETPVRFRTSPPREALKPRRAGGTPGGVTSGSACACPPGRGPPSPRRRRAAPTPPRRHRPALDFDKMQQLKVVRSWRAVGGAHTGELSVFCW